MKQNLHTNSAVYTFALYPAETVFTPIAGIYIFIILPTGDTPSEFYTLLYIGITNNFKTRLNAHHKIARARELGMTHIGIIRKSSGRRRKTIERDLLRSLNPPLNQTWIT